MHATLPVTRRQICTTKSEQILGPVARSVWASSSNTSPDLVAVVFYLVHLMQNTAKVVNIYYQLMYIMLNLQFNSIKIS